MRAAARRRSLPPLWRRVLAGLVDVALAAVVSSLAIWAGAMRFDAWVGDGSLPVVEQVAVTLHARRSWAVAQLFAVTSPLVFVHGFSGVLGGRSPGAWVLGLRAVDRDGLPAESGRLVVRALLYLTWPATLFLAPLLVLVGPSQRGLHDVLSGVWIVRAGTPRPRQ